jgi:serine/threonine protein phosphatase 1
VATIAIGDVHGNAAALDDLLQRVLPELTASDTLVFLGDYIDRGPDTRLVLDRLVALRADPPCPTAMLLGNHEEWLLKTFDDFTSHSWLLGMEGLATIASYSPAAALAIRAAVAAAGRRLVLERGRLPYERFFDAVPSAHVDLLRSLRLFYRSPDVVCVHGGVPLDGTLVEEAPSSILIWGTSDFPAMYQGSDLVVYGHWNDCVVGADGWPAIRAGARTFGIDTIACGVLTALRFPDLRTFQSGRHS